MNRLLTTRQRLLLWALLTAATLAQPCLAVAQAPMAGPDPGDLRAYLVERAHAYGADVDTVLAVALCETRSSPFSTMLVGRLGERGIGQWLPGRGNAWDWTPAWREGRRDIIALYREGHADAPWLDVDQLAWAFGTDATTRYGLTLRRQWSCYRA